jgi:hypothetical protein
MIAFSSDVLSLMLLQFTVRIRRFLLGGRFGIDVDSVLDLFVLWNRILAERGVKSGKNPTTDAIKSSEVFPNNYTAFRNDRGTLGGGGI